MTFRGSFTESVTYFFFCLFFGRCPIRFRHVRDPSFHRGENFWTVFGRLCEDMSALVLQTKKQNKTPQHKMVRFAVPNALRQVSKVWLANLFQSHSLGRSYTQHSHDPASCSRARKKYFSCQCENSQLWCLIFQISVPPKAK